MRVIKMKMLFVLTCLAFVSSIPSSMQAENTSITAHQLESAKLIIDGKLNEPAWGMNDSAIQFIQSEPRQDEIASEETIVKLRTDGDNLFIGIHCRSSDREQINTQLKSRDDATGDRVTVYVSGSGDNETGYLFRVNAAGVMADAYMSSDGRQADFSWDGVWYSAVSLESAGWSAEMKIPFKTMRLMHGAEWKIGFGRYCALKNETDCWPAIKVKQGRRMSGLAKLECIAPSRPGLNLELYPIGLIKYDRIGDKKYSANGGLNISWSPTPATRLDFTGNPDFAQIESDPDRLNLSRYETYFTEKRPFFIEGASKFETPVKLFYSRRIGKRLPDGQTVPIYSAGKYQGSFGKYNISVLGAVCGALDYHDWLGNTSTEPQCIFPVLRIKRSFGQNSSLGVFYGSKEADRSYQRLYSLDGVWRTQDMEWNNQLAFSDNMGTKRGFAYKSMFKQSGQSFISDAVSEKYDKNFNASDVGYVAYNGENHSITAGPIWRQKGIFQSFYTGAGGTFFKLEGDPGYTKIASIIVEPNFQKWGLSANANYYWQYEMGLWYNYWNCSLWIWQNTESKLTISPNLQYSSWTYNYRRAYFGPNGSLSVYAAYRLRSNIELAWQGNNVLEWRPDRSFEKASWIHEFWFKWSLSRDLGIKLYYNPNWETHYHKVNVLFSYNFSPKSWVYLALNEGLDNSTGRLKTGDRIITLKASRLFWW